MNNIRLALGMLKRDWHAGEWRVLIIALFLAVGSLSTVGLFSDRVHQALQLESHSLLGADLRINSKRPLPQLYRDEAYKNDLKVVTTASFPSMVSSNQDSLLSEIQALGEGYPLRGNIWISDSIESNLTATAVQTAGRIAKDIPASGTVWADDRLIRRLSLEIGDVVKVGSLSLRLVAQVTKDVDQSVSFASVAPRVQINLADLPATGLVQEGSRINYRLLIAGESSKVENFRQWLHLHIQPGEKIEDVRDARPEIRQALERAEHFLGLAALMSFVLAGIAMALAARQFITNHLDSCAVMRCMGATQNQVLVIFLYQFIWMGIIAILLGNVIGWFTQASLVQIIPELRDANLPAPSLLPFLQAGISGLALFLGFTFLPLWQLKSVTPLRVIRRELGVPNANTSLIYLSGISILSILFLWQAGSAKLGLFVLAGLVTGLVIFVAIAWASLHLLASLPLGNRYVFTNLIRHGRGNTIQIAALSLGGMSLLLLTLVRTELMQNWQDRLPPDTPNRFIVNVQADQREPVQQFLEKQGLPTPNLYPMVRGRLIAINSRPINSDDYPDQRARGLVERETNLSWSEQIPFNNQITKGTWWTPSNATGNPLPEISLEEGLSKTLGIHINDTLTYDIGGSEYTAKVINLRKVRWDSMQVNFFILTTPGMLENYSTSYLSSFYLPSDKLAAGDDLLKSFPNLLVIDTEAIITQVRHVMDQIAQTLGVIFLFTLLSGLAVLYAALLATQDERIYQSAILRTLGADSQYLRRQQLTEFAVIGALSGALASASAAILGWVLAKYVLDITFVAHATLWFTGILSGMLLVMLSGWLITRKVVKLPPLQVLQN